MDDAGLNEPVLVQSDRWFDLEMPALPAHSDVISCFLSLYLACFSFESHTLLYLCTCTPSGIQIIITS